MNTITEIQLRKWLGEQQSKPDKMVTLLLLLANKKYTPKGLIRDVLYYNEMDEEALREAYEDE